MPPQIRITEEDILTAALALVREQGSDALNARSLAARLGCSVQPIFRAFDSMQTVRTVLIHRAEQLYNQEMLAALAGPDGFLGMGLAYIGFARREKNLFRLLFMSGTFAGPDALLVAGMTEGDDEVLEALCDMTGLDRARAQRLYSGIWFTTHGIAALVAAGGCDLTEDEARQTLGTAFRGLLSALENEEEV
jgi:AcrR family transcriptional regulator